jgi:hypothetical protein
MAVRLMDAHSNSEAAVSGNHSIVRLQSIRYYDHCFGVDARAARVSPLMLNAGRCSVTE